MRITCGIPDTQCSWDNCDTCEVGAAWLKEQEQKKNWRHEAIEETIEACRKAYKEYGPNHERTVKAQFIRDACKRMEAKEVADVHECPGCRTRHAKGVNFCSMCGQRLKWRK